MSNNTFIPVSIPSNHSYTPPTQEFRSVDGLRASDVVTVVESVPGGYGTTRNVQKAVSELRAGDVVAAKESLPGSYGATRDTFVKVGATQTVLFFNK